MASGAAHPAPTGVLEVALCQMNVTDDKAANIATMEGMVADAKGKGAEMVVLGEIWNGPYATSEFPGFAEPIPEVGGEFDEEKSPSLAAMRRVASKEGVWLVGGSVSEVGSDGSYYNTCTVWDPRGSLVGKYRKMHLFDIDIPGGITFRESDVLRGGDALCTFDTPWGRFGVGICYDLRFPHLAALYRDAGCVALLYPGAFNLTTGPKHWELLQRARALDTQAFVLTCSPARNPGASYQAWGHSTISDPWGAVLATTDHEPAVLTATLDMASVAAVRTQIPTATQLRTDVYSMPALKDPKEGEGEEEEEKREKGK